MVTPAEPVWVVQSNLGSTHDFELLRESCRHLGLPFVPVAAIPFSDELPSLPVEPQTVFYGSSNFVTNVHRSARWKPGVFFDEEEFRFSTAQRRLGHHLLNADAQVTSMGDLAGRSIPPDRVLFFRPDGDLKEFAGGTQTFGEFQAWCEKLRPGGFALDLSTLVVVADPKTIQHEWRLFLVEGKVVSGSRYRELGWLSVRAEVPAEVTAFAEEMAILWSPSPVFVLDVALFDGDLRVVEVNGFNSAGFYASDIHSIVKAVSSHVIHQNYRS